MTTARCEYCNRRVAKYTACLCAKAQEARVEAAKSHVERAKQVNVYLLTFDTACITGGPNGEDVRMLGVFSSQERVQAVIDKYNTFVGTPKQGFTIRHFPLDKEIKP